MTERRTRSPEPETDPSAVDVRDEAMKEHAAEMLDHAEPGAIDERPPAAGPHADDTDAPSGGNGAGERGSPPH